MINNISPPPRQDKELTGHTWQEWFRQIWSAIQNMNNYDLNAIGAGVIPGKTPVNIYGRNSDVDNTVECVWMGPAGLGGPYVFPATPIRMQVVSTDNTQDTAGGTGARSVKINYLDTNFLEQEETINLNGTTAVPTVATNILRVNAFYVVVAGTGKVPLGNLSLQSVGGATTYAYIIAGYNNSTKAVYTVPANKSLYITSWHVSAGAATLGHFTQFNILSNATLNGVKNDSIYLVHSALCLTDAAIETRAEIPFKIPATCDIYITAVSDAAGANVIATTNVQGWIE